MNYLIALHPVQFENEVLILVENAEDEQEAYNMAIEILLTVKESDVEWVDSKPLL